MKEESNWKVYKTIPYLNLESVQDNSLYELFELPNSYSKIKLYVLIRSKAMWVLATQEDLTDLLVTKF